MEIVNIEGENLQIFRTTSEISRKNLRKDVVFDKVKIH